MAIIGTLSDLRKRGPYPPGIAEGLDFLAHLDPAVLVDREPGYFERIAIDGDRLFAMHQAYHTKPVEEARYEAHRRYVDLQYIAAGSERVRLETLERLFEEEPYDSDRDVAFYRLEGGMDLVLRAGMVAIFFPEDAHAPCLDSEGKGIVRKSVIKVAL